MKDLPIAPRRAAAVVRLPAALFVLVFLGCSDAPGPAGAQPSADAKKGVEVGPPESAKSAPKPPPKNVGDWPCLYGPEHDNVSHETGLIKTWPEKGPPVLWKIDTGPTYAAPSIVGNRLILFHRVGDEEVVECLAADTGKPVWRHAYPTAYVDRYGYNGGPRASPVIEGDLIYTLGAEGKMHALKLETGAVVWTRDLNKEYEVEQNFFGVGASPMIDGRLILLNVGGPKAGIIGIDKADGKTVWTATQDGASYSTPTVVDGPAGRLAVFLTRAGVVGLEPATGKVRFTHPFRSKTYESVNAANPVVVDDLLYVSSAYRTGGVMLRMSADSVAEVWKSDVLRSHWNTPMPVGAHMYGFDGRHEDETTLKCVEIATGKVIWTKRGLGRGSMIRADGAYWIMSEDGRLIRAELSAVADDEEGARNPKGYVQTASVELLKPPCWIAPVLSRGKLYVRNEKTLICLDVKEKR